MVVACVALFLSLGGAGLAASKLAIPANSVGTAQLKNSAVNSLKVADHSLQAKDFAAGQLPAGPAGPAGATGPAGPVGPGITSWAIVKADGTLDRSSRVASITHAGTGAFDVKFTTSVAACALLASAGTATAGSVTHGGVADFNRTKDPATIEVTTSVGTTPANRGFTLAAICPATAVTTTTATTTGTTTTP